MSILSSTHPSTSRTNAGIYILRAMLSLLVTVTVAVHVGIAWPTYLKAWLVSLGMALGVVMIVVFYLMAVSRKTLDKSSGDNLLYSIIMVMGLLVDYWFGFTLFQIIAISMASALVSLIVTPLLPLHGKEPFFE